VTEGKRTTGTARTGVSVSLLTGGTDRPYALGLVRALVARGVQVDFVASDGLESSDLRSSPHVSFLNLRGDQTEQVSWSRKAMRLARYYIRILWYAARAEPRVFHVLWNNRLEIFDRTALMGFYKLLGKRVVLTAHNVNAGRRDGRDSTLNRLTLRMQYRMAEHIFVHAQYLRRELTQVFGVPACRVSVIPFGTNEEVPDTSLTTREARGRLGVGDSERTILFFGKLRPYKGIETLLAAFTALETAAAPCRLFIVGKTEAGCEEYVARIRHAIDAAPGGRRVVLRDEYVPAEQLEVYFKAADVVVLPYREVSQSGVLVLAYQFGLPVIATDIEGFRQAVVPGKTGLLFREGDPCHLARALEDFFRSEMYRDETGRRADIAEVTRRRHAWDVVGEMTVKVYESLSGPQGSSRRWGAARADG